MTGAASFADATRVEADGEGRYRWQVPDGWQQGRGAFGGLVLGAMVRAAEASERDRARRPRVVNGELCAPVLPGPATLDVAHLRRGSGTTNVEVRALQGAEVVARASVLLAADRKVETPAIVRAAPALPPPEALAEVTLPVPPAPTFSRHVSFRPVGPAPFSGAAEPSAAGHVGFRAPLPHLDAAAVVGLCDCWWPAVLAMMRTPRPTATVAFTAELLADPATLDPARPLAYLARVDGASGGFVIEQRELWQGDRLVAVNHQTFAIIV